MKIRLTPEGETEENQENQTPLEQDLLAIAYEMETFEGIDYEKYYAELNAAGVKLDEDPVERGLSHLNEKIAQIDGQKNRISYILTLAIKNENEIEHLHAFIDRIYKKHAAEALVTTKIAELANQGLRDAAVQNKLKELIDQQNDVQRSLSKAKTFTKIARQVFETLDSTNKNISRQLTTVQAMIDIGEVSRIVRN